MDLLTVLLHEIGHWSGFGHDSGLAVMDEVLGTGQRAQLDLDGTSATAVPGQPVSGAQFSGATVDLRNATAADPTAGITVTINANGTATVTGAVNAADNGTSSVPVTEVIGNVLNRFRLNAPDTDSTWHLTGLNEGYLTPDGLNPIQFTSVDYLNGGSAKDTFIIDQLAGATTPMPPAPTRISASSCPSSRSGSSAWRRT